jgi:hypothetical protein
MFAGADDLLVGIKVEMGAHRGHRFHRSQSGLEDSKRMLTKRGGEGVHAGIILNVLAQWAHWRCFMN